jgi:hypothetical protein
MEDRDRPRIFADPRFQILIKLVQEKMDLYTAWNLSSIVWATAKMNYENMPAALQEQLKQATWKKMFDFKPQELKMVIWSYATMLNHPGAEFLKVSHSFPGIVSWRYQGTRTPGKSV